MDSGKQGDNSYGWRLALERTDHCFGEIFLHKLDENNDDAVQNESGSTSAGPRPFGTPPTNQAQVPGWY
jgi:hypothetical protein